MRSDGICRPRSPHRLLGLLALCVLLWTQVVPAASQQQSDAPLKTAPVNAKAEQLIRDGRASEAVELLRPALSAIDSASQPLESGQLQLHMGQALFVLGELAGASNHLEQSLGLAEESGQSSLVAQALNALGNLASAQGRQEEALADYGEAVALAESAGQPLLAAQAAINAGRAAVALRDPQRAGEFAQAAGDRLNGQAENQSVANTRIALGRLYRELGGAENRLQAFSNYQSAVASGERLGDKTLLAYSLGYIGEMYEREGRLREALDYTGKALGAALNIQRDDILYRLQWQTGRLLRALGSETEALSAYRQAIATLQNIRSGLSTSPLRRRLSFRAFVGDLYYQLADLLLRKADRLTADAAQAALLDARDTIEQLKAVELEDYFQDDCVTAFEAKQRNLDREVDQRTLALYPIILPDRLELLLSLPDRIQRVSVPVDARTLTLEARALRQALETYRGGRYRVHARRLYDWLIRPWEGILAESGIDTLVFLPDGALRLIPIAALYDGEQHLIQRLAVATSPGLVLTDPTPLERDNPLTLVSGLSQAVQGFSALPAVEVELAALQALFGGRQIKDQEFVKSRILRELQQSPYSIVHIATHGEIESDVRKSYLLTYDSRLTMDELEAFISRTRYRTEGVELLTLSACRTAVGDDRAALGLAGIALKAGARSALATLWSISDEATGELIPLFYRKLQQTGVTKARALQQAQQALLASKRFSHPGYWAPYLLVGNWL